MKKYRQPFEKIPFLYMPTYQDFSRRGCHVCYPVGIHLLVILLRKFMFTNHRIGVEHAEDEEQYFYKAGFKDGYRAGYMGRPLNRYTFFAANKNRRG